MVYMVFLGKEILEPLVHGTLAGFLVVLVEAFDGHIYRRLAHVVVISNIRRQYGIYIGKHYGIRIYHASTHIRQNLAYHLVA